jgi:hypothetical protein
VQRAQRCAAQLCVVDQKFWINGKQFADTKTLWNMFTIVCTQNLSVIRIPVVIRVCVVNACEAHIRVTELMQCV